MSDKQNNTMEKIVSLCKRRGFIFPCSEIYGGLANSYSYGPYGTALKNNIEKLWWRKFVENREDMVGMDGPIILHPKVWEASGHTEGFNDAMVDCKACKYRFRVDHLIQEAIGEDMEGDLDGMNKKLQEEEIKCPQCGKKDWTDIREINMMFKTQMNGFDGEVYLRPETAGAIFLDFKNIIDSLRVKVPFGIAQTGKAFRNEIVAKSFIFRVREFEQMEIEYFIHPEADWESIFEEWLKKQEEFAQSLGAKKEDLRRYEHPESKLSHYSKKTVDVEYNYPFGGFDELFGLAHRGDFDLTQHAKYSKKDLSYTDPFSGEKYVPHVIEPTFGLDRCVLTSLCAAYTEEEVSDTSRVVLKFPRDLAPVKIAVFPLLRNREELVGKAREVFDILKEHFVCEFDDNGNIGKRYRRQDEIGTPYCVTVDFDSLDNDDVTIRDRDTTEQNRVKLGELLDYFKDRLISL